MNTILKAFLETASDAIILRSKDNSFTQSLFNDFSYAIIAVMTVPGLLDMSKKELCSVFGGWMFVLMINLEEKKKNQFLYTEHSLYSKSKKPEILDPVSFCLPVTPSFSWDVSYLFQIGISSRDASTPILLAKNIAGHLSGSLRTIGSVAVGQYGKCTMLSCF